MILQRCIQNPVKKLRETFFPCQKLVQISGNYIKFLKERIKTSVAIEKFKTQNQCKTPQVVGATDGSTHVFINSLNVKVAII